MLFVVHSIVFSKLKYKILHGFAWVHLTWKRCILNGLTGSCKICSIFMPRLGMNLARLCAKSCQNVMGSHGKSWQDLANFFLRGSGNLSEHRGRRRSRRETDSTAATTAVEREGARGVCPSSITVLSVSSPLPRSMNAS